MKLFSAETIEQWNILSAKLHKYGYKPWQYQYGWWCEEGLHVWFWKTGKDDIEVVTHSEEVSKAIYKFES